MEESLKEILAAIPHREPFLWVDEIVTRDETTICTEKTFAKDLAVFKGHYPGNPVVPGVLLCEALFQSGALLISHRMTKEENVDKVPVITRITGAKFKKMVLPGDTMTMTVEIRDIISQVFFLRGTGKVAGKTAVRVDFCCTLAPRPQE